ncbi:peptidylprolyl isomerase [Xanthobacter autotrophicus]
MAPVRLASGWHIVRMVEMKPGGTEPVPFEQVKDRLATQLRRQRIDEAR